MCDGPLPVRSNKSKEIVSGYFEKTTFGPFIFRDKLIGKFGSPSGIGPKGLKVGPGSHISLFEIVAVQVCDIHRFPRSGCVDEPTIADINADV